MFFRLSKQATALQTLFVYRQFQLLVGVCACNVLELQIAKEKGDYVLLVFY